MAAKQGYQGFGSFFSDNVEDMIAAAAKGEWDVAYPSESSESLEPVAILKELGVERADDLPPFGHAFGKRFYHVDQETFTFLNHGAFGGASKISLEAASRWRRYGETECLRFIDRQLFPQLVKVMVQTADFIGAPVNSIALIENATYGLNCAIAAAAKEMRRESAGKDVAFILDIGYGSVKKMLTEHVQETSSGVVFTWPMKFPLGCRRNLDLIGQVREGLSKAQELATSRGGRIGLAVFDHITSNTALVMPIKELAAMAKSEFNARRVLIDGAHGLQSQHLAMEDRAAGRLPPWDWYASNAHKWLASGKGVAVLYAATEEVRSLTKPLVVSHGAGSGFASGFIWDGCRDYANALSLPALFQWWRTVDSRPAAGEGGGEGGEEGDNLSASRRYCRSLLRQAVAHLTSLWGTTTHAPLSLYSHMALIELPQEALPEGAVDVVVKGRCIHTATSTHAKLVQDTLFHSFSIECPVKCLPTLNDEGDETTTTTTTMGNRLYLRISAYVYNEMEDFVRLGKVVKEDLKLKMVSSSS